GGAWATGRRLRALTEALMELLCSALNATGVALVHSTGADRVMLPTPEPFALAVVTTTLLAPSRLPSWPTLMFEPLSLGCQTPFWSKLPLFEVASLMVTLKGSSSSVPAVPFGARVSTVPVKAT